MRSATTNMAHLVWTSDKPTFDLKNFNSAICNVESCDSQCWKLRFVMLKVMPIIYKLFNGLRHLRTLQWTSSNPSVFYFIFYFINFATMATILWARMSHPVNIPCGRKPEYLEKTHDFRQSVDYILFSHKDWVLVDLTGDQTRLNRRAGYANVHHPFISLCARTVVHSLLFWKGNLYWISFIKRYAHAFTWLHLFCRAVWYTDPCPCNMVEGNAYFPSFNLPIHVVAIKSL